jgi:thiol-disulfide isomerase/thioredoxin
MHSNRPASYLLGAVLFTALFLTFGTAVAEQESRAELIKHRNLEVALLHLPIDRVVLGALPVWDEKTQKLRLRVPGEVFDDSRPILILHLWATWCGPCKEEFRLWTKLRERMQRQFGYDVQIVHIAMDHDTNAMAEFIQSLGDKMPPGPKYFDRDERLADQLRPSFKGRDLPTLPITLWLGPARTVRQALTGSIADRVSEVMDSTQRLLRTIKARQDAIQKGQSKDEEWDTFTRASPCQCPCICN